MRRILLSCLLGLMVAATLPAADKKDDPKGSARGGDPVDAAKQLRPGDVEGTVVSNNGTTLVLRMEFESLQPNGSGNGGNSQYQQMMKQHQSLLKSQQQLARAKNPQQAMQAYRQMMQKLQQQGTQHAKGGQQNPFKVVKSHVDYEIEIDDSVVYRTLVLPTMFDDKGDIKKLTAAEVKELRGDGKLAGYQSGPDKAGKDAEVKVHLSKNKETEMKLRATVVYIEKESSAAVKKEKKK